MSKEKSTRTSKVCRACHKTKQKTTGGNTRENHLCETCYNAIGTCACGCGGTFPLFQSTGKKRKYVSQEHWWKVPENRKKRSKMVSKQITERWKRPGYKETHKPPGGRKPTCLACGKRVEKRNPRMADRSRENSLCDDCYSMIGICACGCGKTFPLFSSRGKRRKYFSSACYWRVPEHLESLRERQSKGMKEVWRRPEYREARFGSNHPGWKGGTSLYCSCGFTTEIKQQVKERDNFECQNPNCPNKGNDEVLLHIHHIDGDKHNNDLSNLITLCANCHHAMHPRKSGPPLPIETLRENR